MTPPREVGGRPLSVRRRQELTKAARRFAGRAVAMTRRHYPELAPWQRMGHAADYLAAGSAEFLLEGDLDLARQYAFAHELVRTRADRIRDDHRRGDTA